MNNIEYIIGLTISIIILIWFLRKILPAIRKLGYVKKIKRTSISEKVKAKANKKFDKLLKKFKHTHHREPNHNELFRIIINASHITIRHKGKSGHWGRQKIRKYLLEKHNIVDKYIMK